MKKLIYAFCLVILSACGGVSDEDKRIMEYEIGSTIENAYWEAGISCMLMKVTITDIEKDTYFHNAKYNCSFKGNFDSEGKEMSIYGMAGLDELNRVVRMPEEYGDGILAIDIILVSKGIDIEDNRESKYVLPIFMNHSFEK
jgi:hypothetical protein